MPRQIELLAPARDAAIALEAIEHGADAVYMGASRFGARMAAGNTVADIARVCEAAHRFNARVYVTVNTIVHDSELRAVEQLVRELYDAQVDALIVQDMALLRLDLPPIALHASTQCDIRTVEKARFLEAVGFSQLVLARELTLAEIGAIHDAVAVPLEGFVHGALCVSYSGRCQVSQLVKNRSANRGECAQLCRLPYDLVDGEGRVWQHAKHLLSLRDLNQGARLDQMLAAGVSSFKIEGRLKEMGYVKNVVAHYRQLIDEAIARSAGRYVRLSTGASDYTFTPDVAKSFNRSFTHYFLDERRPSRGNMASLDTPKSLGEPLGPVTRVNGNRLTIATTAQLANGDGLSYFAPDGQYEGMRVNRVEGCEAIMRERVRALAGTMVYRTTDKVMDDLLSRRSAQRTIAVDALLKTEPQGLSLTLTDERGHTVTVSEQDVDVQPARTPQSERQRSELAKLGGTIYRLREATVLEGLFIPSSSLAALRRQGVARLDACHSAAYRREARRPEDKTARYPSTALVSADNVVNQVAERFYREHGVHTIVPAVEAGGEVTHAMHTRYCLRRELGACLRTPQGSRLPQELFLRSAGITMQVHCDCSHCEMHLELV